MNEKLKTYVSLVVAAVFFLATLLSNPGDMGFATRVLSSVLGGVIGFVITYVAIGWIAKQ